MSCSNSSSAHERQDLVRTRAALWLWWLPIGLIVLANITWNGHHFPATIMGVMLTIATAWIGTVCYINGRRCGRTHCKIDGILFPLLSIVGLMNLLGVISFGWDVYSAAFWIILFISYIPEWFGMTYFTKADRA
jgi:hypothetical protein